MENKINTIKIFISQPMKDKTDEEILAEREKAIKGIKESFKKHDIEVTIIDSFFKDAPHEANPLWYLGESIKCLSEADLAYFVKGWDKARGCRIENICATAYGIDCIEENEGEDDYDDDYTKKNEEQD